MQIAERHTGSIQATPNRTRPALLAGSAVLLAAPLLLVAPAAHWAGDADLLLLMRGMAGIKSALALAALGLVAWRLGKPELSRARIASYVGGVWALALATGLIWQLTAIVPASMLFHAATLTLLVTAWRDTTPLSARHLGEDHGQRPAEGQGAGQRTDQRVAGLAIHPAADQAVDQEVRNDHHGDDQQEEQVFERQRYG